MKSVVRQFWMKGGESDEQFVARVCEFVDSLGPDSLITVSHQEKVIIWVWYWSGEDTP